MASASLTAEGQLNPSVVGIVKLTNSVASKVASSTTATISSQCRSEKISLVAEAKAKVISSTTTTATTYLGDDDVSIDGDKEREYKESEFKEPTKRKRKRRGRNKTGHHQGAVVYVSRHRRISRVAAIAFDFYKRATNICLHL